MELKLIGSVSFYTKAHRSALFRCYVFGTKVYEEMKKINTKLSHITETEILNLIS